MVGKGVKMGIKNLTCISFTPGSDTVQNAYNVLVHIFQNHLNSEQLKKACYSN